MEFSIPWLPDMVAANNFFSEYLFTGLTCMQEEDKREFVELNFFSKIFIV